MKDLFRIAKKVAKRVRIRIIKGGKTGRNKGPFAATRRNAQTETQRDERVREELSAKKNLNK